MDELLKKLLESELLNEETVTALREHISGIEAEAEARAAGRLEGKYKEDMAKLYRATELMITDGIKSAVTEMAQERATLRRSAAKAARAVAEADARADLKVRRATKAIQITMEGNLRKELEEFRTQRSSERKAVVKQIREMATRSEADRDAFVKRGALILETVVEKMLRAKIKELHEDVKAAKRSDFGRKIMEAFEGEFRAKFFSADKEASKVARAAAGLKRKLDEAERKHAAALTEAKNRADAAERKASKLVEGHERARTKAQLLSKLSGDQRKQMGVLLEGTTGDLRAAFKKFLPSILTEGATRRDRLKEGKKPLLELREGTRAGRGGEGQGVDPALVQLRKLAGN